MVLFGRAADDKKLNVTLKKLGVTNIPGIEEANMFKESGEVIHFKNPKGEQQQKQAGLADREHGEGFLSM